MLSKGQLTQLAAKKFWILDIDDTLFPKTNGLHAANQKTILKNLRQFIASDTSGSAVENALNDILLNDPRIKKDITALSPQEIDKVTVPLTEALTTCIPDRAFDVLAHLYGDEYSRIEPDKTLVDAFNTACEKGIEIYLYTNGPAHPEQGKSLHAQKVLRALGFEEGMIESLRPRTHSAIDSAKHVFGGKPTIQSMQRVLGRFNITPKDALMADDSLANLRTADVFYIAGLCPRTSEEEQPPKADHNIIYINDTAETLLQIARAHPSAT